MMNIEQNKQEQAQLTEYTPEPTGVVAAIAVKVLGLCDVRSLILVESEWREVVASPEARAYLAALDAHLALHAQLAQAGSEDRFASEMTVHKTLEEARASWERHQQDMRQERRERFERRIRAALEQNPAALTYATPHGLAAYLADALTGMGEANHE